MKFSEIKTCTEIVEKLEGEGKIRLENGSTAKLKITLASIGFKKLRIFRLPFEISNNNIKFCLLEYGEIISVDDEYWSRDFAPTPVLVRNGTRSIKCFLKNHVPYFIIVKG